MRDDVKEPGSSHVAPESGRPESGRPESGQPESGQSEAAPPQDWRAWLAGASPREILARIVQGDPLRLRARVARKLRDGAYLLDADRVHLRSLARCARAATRYRGRPELGSWLDGLVDAAVADLLREDDECVRRGEAPQETVHGETTQEPTDGRATCRVSPDRSGPDRPGPARPDRDQGGALVELSLPLGLDPRSLAFACHAFNRLPNEDRRAFFELVVRGRALEVLARDERGGATVVARRARRALRTLLSSDEHDLPPSGVEHAAVSPPPSEPRDERGESTL